MVYNGQIGSTFNIYILVLKQILHTIAFKF